MGKRWWWLLLSVILLIQVHGPRGCSIEERMSLLEFKAYVASNGYDADYLLSSWVEEDPPADCCLWHRVFCSNTTHHVIHLSLDNIMELQIPSPAPLNISTFQAFKELRILNLSNNNINGLIEEEDCRGMLRLQQLETLDLSGNLFLNSSSLCSLSLLTSLKDLNLSSNGMEGPFPAPGMKLMAFRGLETLGMSFNNVIGNITSSIGELASLKALSLQSSVINGSLAISGLRELKRLEELDLSSNDFEGIIPPCLYNLTSLRSINLSNNRFDGSFSFNSFANLSQLEAVMLTCGGDKLKVDVEYLNQSPSFQLKVLQLSNCSLTDPNFLHHQHGLRFLDLSFCKLKGTFPKWLLENNAEFQVIDLSNNFFTGRLSLPRNPMRNILWVDVSNNLLNGKLAEDFGIILSTLKGLILSNNQFEGDLPFSVSAMRELETLDLSFNNFSREVPKELFTSCIKLEELLLSHNQFCGDIFSSRFNTSELYRVEFGDNRFTGEIPSWLPTLQNLTILALQNNSFQGQFPCEKVLLVGYLDLSYNSMSGPLPTCFDPGVLTYLILEGNNFSGSIPKALFNFSKLVVLNLGYNNLSGSLSDLIFHELPNLRYLLLGKNHLNGLIPRQLCQSQDMGIMDLSSNSFSGPIPPCFYNITLWTLDESDRDDAYFLLENAVGDESFTRPHIIPGRPTYGIEEVEILLATKNMVRLYKGVPLYLMSGLDFSCNNLTGKIPSELGKLSSIHMLNLSHNQLLGPIPTSFSNLAEIESLDLSFNSLSGEIPLELINLHSLSTFNVTHNKLSGRIPFTNGQFSTFGESSYGENPLLCGPPLKTICPMDHAIDTPDLPVSPPDETEGKWLEIDYTIFQASFTGTYLVFLLAFVTLLFVNPLWRRRWFSFIEDCLCSSTRRYLVSDAIRKLSTKSNG